MNRLYWLGAACVLLLTTCSKKNDPATPAEPRITSFTVPNAQTTFRGDTILVRLDASYSGTQITPVVTFEGGEALAPRSEEPQEFERCAPLSYAIYLGTGQFKRYAVVVIPSAPPRIEWAQAAARAYRGGCQEEMPISLRTEHIGTITDQTNVRVRFEPEPGSETPAEVTISARALRRGIADVSVPIARQTPTGVYRVRPVATFANGLIPDRQAAGTDVLTLTVTPQIHGVLSLSTSRQSAFTGCGVAFDQPYSLTVIDAQNRRLTYPLTWSIGGQVFQAPPLEQVPAGPVRVEVREGPVLIFEGTSTVTP